MASRYLSPAGYEPASAGEMFTSEQGLRYMLTEQHRKACMALGSTTDPDPGNCPTPICTANRRYFDSQYGTPYGRS